MTPGSRLPSEVILAKMFQVSRPTLREYFKVLQREGKITTINGSGTYLLDQNRRIDNQLNDLQGYRKNDPGSRLRGKIRKFSVWTLVILTMTGGKPCPFVSKRMYGFLIRSEQPIESSVSVSWRYISGTYYWKYEI